MLNKIASRRKHLIITYVCFFNMLAHSKVFFVQMELV